MKNYWKTYVRLLLLPSLVLGLSAGCSDKGQTSAEKALARVGNIYLYPSDLASMIPQGMLAEDSASFVAAYLDQWVRRQLLLEQAEFNLDTDRPDFRHLIADYRASLLIHAYQEQLLAEKTDTAITQKEIAAYYQQNLSQFILTTPIVKALYIRMQKDNSRVSEIKNLIRSDTDQAFESLVNLSYQYADRFDFFDDRWVSFKRIIQSIPGSPGDPEEFLRSQSLLEVEDDASVHLLRIHDYQLTGETAPAEYVHDRIREMIITERRQLLLNELEENLYREAAGNQEFDIYDQQ